LRVACSFDELVVFLKDKKTVAMARALLQRVHLSSTSRHSTPVEELEPDFVNTRVFLAGYMIAYRPTHVFESMGALEQGLFESAGPLLESFQSIMDAIHSSPTRDFQSAPPELTRKFPGLLCEYLRRFKVWKIPDAKKLTCRIKHALNALYMAEGLLPASEPLDSKLRLEFRTQIDLLRTKLSKIGGAEVLEQLDRERTAVLPSCSGTGGSGGGSPRGDEGASSSVGVDLLQTGRASNEELAHELVLDPNFRLDGSGGFEGENPVYRRIRLSFQSAFWDSLVDDLRLDTPCFVRVLRVLGEIRDGIRGLAGPQNIGNIMEVVDLDFIRDQAEKGIYGWQECVHLVSRIFSVIQQVRWFGSVLPLLCCGLTLAQRSQLQSPTRDEESRTMWEPLRGSMESATATDQPRVFCKTLEFLHERLNAMRIDCANARLRMIAPVLQRHGVDYERSKFNEKIAAGLTLERTKASDLALKRWAVRVCAYVVCA
jgi:hypothetical protein